MPSFGTRKQSVLLATGEPSFCPGHDYSDVLSFKWYESNSVLLGIITVSVLVGILNTMVVQKIKNILA